jgi:tetratricopeptide (TPR) repeat protein
LKETAGSPSVVSRIATPAALIVAATVLAYLPSLSGDFIWNDGDYVTAAALRSLGGLYRIWTRLGATQQYYPLLHSAFWVQHRMFGDRPLGYHVVTLLLHAGSAVLFALVLRRLLAEDGKPNPLPGAEWLAALLFALHPVHVESVAWITEQKNTLSLAFYLASALVYLRFDSGRRTGDYIGALALFALSMACKTVTATLPAALLVAFWWKRGRLGWRRDVRPLLPWLVLGGAWGVFSSWVERAYVGAQGADFSAPIAARLLVAGRAVWFYAGKLVWPSGLNFIYPRWTADAGVWWQWLFPLGVPAAGFALWTLRRRTRAPFAAFLFFVGSLVPVLGFVNLYGARYSWVWDHWQYLPDLGPIALAAAALAGLWRRLRGPAWLGRGLAAAFALVLGALSWSHEQMFHDDQRLFLTTIARNPGCWMAHYNLGVLWSKTPGRRDDATAQYEEAIRLEPGFAEAHDNLGAVLRQSGRVDEAVLQFREAIRLKPDLANAHVNLAGAYLATPGGLDRAISEYREAIRLKPEFTVARNYLGAALEQAGRTDEAIGQFEEAIRLAPDFADPHEHLGEAYLGMPGKLDDAVAQFEDAVRLRPDSLSDWYLLGVCRHRKGDLPAAAEALRQALRIAPDNPTIQRALAAVQRQAGGSN